MKEITKRTLKEFNQLIEKYVKALKKRATTKQLINIDHLHLRTEAIRLAQIEFNK